MWKVNEDLEVRGHNLFKELTQYSIRGTEKSLEISRSGHSIIPAATRISCLLKGKQEWQPLHHDSQRLLGDICLEKLRKRERTRPGKLVSCLKFEAGTYQILSSSNHYVKRFGACFQSPTTTPEYKFNYFWVHSKIWSLHITICVPKTCLLKVNNKYYCDNVTVVSVLMCKSAAKMLVKSKQQKWNFYKCKLMYQIQQNLKSDDIWKETNIY
jgi:hypothetical protein